MKPELAVYDPIEPTIAESMFLRHVFARAYAEPKGRKGTRLRAPQSAAPSLDGMVLVFDCETVEHRLTFGVLEIYEKHRLKTRAVFYQDDLPTSDNPGFERLRKICRALGVRLFTREWLFQHAIWPARTHGGTIAGFNIAYDLSRIADSFEPATKTARLGTRFCNGFAFKHHFTTRKGPQTPVFCRIKRDDRHHVRFEMKAAAVLDVATAAFAYTDRNHSLASGCKAVSAA